MHPILLILTLVMFSCEAESDCNGTPGGTAVEDDCAQCTEGTTGLVANNLMDCAGECGGDSVLSGCDNACNSTAVEDCAGECGGEDILDSCFLCEGDIVYCEDLTDFTLHLNSNGDLYYKSSLPIYGFQMDVLSIEIDFTLSDLAEESGLTMNMNSNEEFTRILVFSTDASSISENCGTLLNIQGSLEDLALTNLLFSTANGEPIPIVIYDCE